MEEIKQMIEQEAADYAQIISERISLTSKINSSDIALAVKHGANLILSKWQEAERWRNVSEELPEVTGPFILELIDGDYQLGYYLDHKYREDSFYSIYDNGIEFLIEDVAKWKPLTKNKERFKQ